jgi:predicted metal-binding protein
MKVACPPLIITLPLFMKMVKHNRRSYQNKKQIEVLKGLSGEINGGRN